VPNGGDGGADEARLRHYRHQRPHSFNAIRELIGPSRLLVGTNNPFWSPRVAVATLAEFGISPAERERIERGNALGLMPALMK
jgi:predicted TIM-barrel fold metal-dependent hydrolase